ncbi:MAG: PEP-utilizing enzyme, partial [Patescibacteria group bacterium]
AKLSAGTDAVVRKSLARIFPKIKDFVHVLTIEEIKTEILPKLSELKARDKGFIFTQSRLYVGRNISDIEKKYGILLERENIGENVGKIKGATAYPGIARGKIRRVMGHKQIHFFKEGEVLVSPMTMPDFLPAMKKAIAFVTDEGGVTCHAAITARELKKPCIVGTKIATQVLKDGDLVEVDATKGIVKILKRVNFTSSKAAPITILQDISQNERKIIDYIKSQRWFFGVRRVDDWLLVYSVEKRDRYIKCIKEEYGIEFAEAVFMLARKDYSLRAINFEQAKDFHALSREKILKNPQILISYIKKNELLYRNIGIKRKKLIQMINKKDYHKSKELFKKIINLYEIASAQFLIIFSLAVKLIDSEANLKNIKGIVKKYGAWKNAVRFKEEAMIEDLLYFFRFLTNKKNLKLNPLLLMKFLTLNEVEAWIDEKLTDAEIKDIISSRKKHGFIYLNLKHEKREVIDNPVEINEIRNYFLRLSEESKKLQNNKEIKGQVAYNSGKIITGLVVVIENKTELKNKKRLIDNKILVAIQTTPHYIPYMGKVKAVITDEGGMTCHAAIIAREMKKPCIVGTKIATQVLKDGDLVEVDAAKGIVKVLKRA